MNTRSTEDPSRQTISGDGLMYIRGETRNDHLVKIYVVHKQERLLSCQLRPTFPPIVEGMRLTEP